MYVRQAIQKSKIIGHAESGRSEFGPKEARLEKEKTPELARMGEASRKSEKKHKGQGSINYCIECAAKSRREIAFPFAGCSYYGQNVPVPKLIRRRV
jgi:hypothetical protein